MGEALIVRLLKIIVVLSVLVSTMMGAVLIGERLYDSAVAECQTYGAAPVAVDDRLACATPEGTTFTP